MTIQDPVEIFSWLHPWWTFWADLTRLLEWRAWAAIGTTSAVIVALRRDDRADKRERLKERALLIALAKYSRVLTMHIRGKINAFPEFAPAGHTTTAVAVKNDLDLIDRLGLMKMVEGAMSEIKMSDLSDPLTIEHFMVARAAVNSISIEIEEVRQGRTPTIGNNATALDNATTRFHEDAARLYRRAYPVTWAIREWSAAARAI